jgi:hypothetical protein
VQGAGRAVTGKRTVSSVEAFTDGKENEPVKGSTNIQAHNRTASSEPSFKERAAGHAYMMEQLRIRNQIRANTLCTLAQEAGHAVAVSAQTAPPSSGTLSKPVSAPGVLSAPSCVQSTVSAMPPPVNGSVSAHPDTSAGAAREAYEVWREAMRERKRAKIEQ